MRASSASLRRYVHTAAQGRTCMYAVYVFIIRPSIYQGKFTACQLVLRYAMHRSSVREVSYWYMSEAPCDDAPCDDTRRGRTGVVSAIV
eukprot:scaffold139720_cov41-Prasinocladus_malaysianus.AAC.1